MLPYTATDENIQKKPKSGFLLRSRASCSISAGRCLELKTFSHFSHVRFISIESRSTPAEWMKPYRLGDTDLMNSSIGSCMLKSHLACSTVMPSFSALASMAFQAGMFRSEIIMDRDRNLMVKPLLPCFSARSTSHWPMTRASAPLPPEMATTLPAPGASNVCCASSYAFEFICRSTYRPLLRMRTVLWPNVWLRKISEAMRGKSLYWSPGPVAASENSVST
mmetsp:Transcript_115757/g.328048  ORF Transcript_115757/g.328048 Transcript_115757/m.328048 type:complete len:222 (+) Transcript_115757:645-1310(+)